MSTQIIKLIKINNLQYNALRDPQVYRRVAGESFRIQVAVAGVGESAVASGGVVALGGTATGSIVGSGGRAAAGTTGAVASVSCCGSGEANQ